MADQSKRIPRDRHPVCNRFRNRVQPAFHVTAKEPTAGILPSATISTRSGQIEFVYENPGAESLEFDEPIRLYACTLCGVKCRRPYDLKRHKQTKHDQSEHWFCPADSCKLSCSPAGLLKELCSTCFKVEFLGYFRSPLTSKVLHSDQRNGYEKYELNGFPRRDKLIKHLKKDHKEEFVSLRAAVSGKEILQKKPLICEAQLFWAHDNGYSIGVQHEWYQTPLHRLQVDGKWSEYDGLKLKAVAEAGFRFWTENDDENYRRLVQAPKFHAVLPWKARDLILELGDDAPAKQRKRGFIMGCSEAELLDEIGSPALMLCQIQEEDSPSSWPSSSILDSAEEVQHQPMDHEAAVSDGSNQPDLPMDSSSAERSIQASSSGLEDSPWSTANTQAQSLFDMGVEEIIAAFDWEAFLNSDLNSGIDIEAVASDQAGSSALDINSLNSGFDFNYSALENGAAFDFDFNDPNSVPHWYFSAEDGAGPDI